MRPIVSVEFGQSTSNRMGEKFVVKQRQDITLSYMLAHGTGNNKQLVAGLDANTEPV